MRKSLPQSPSLIPAPQSIEWRSGQGFFEPLHTILEVPKGQKKNHTEAYTLEINPDGATLTAGSALAQSTGKKTWQKLQTQNPNGPLSSAVTIRDYPSLSIRGVHIDLKLHPPRFDWLVNWLDQLAAWKLNAIVIEYEDKFPYQRLGGIAHKTAWSRDQAKEFDARASHLGIEVIPLVQCLGHLEYVLVHDEYAHLRELPEVYSQACPSRPGTFGLFQQMVSEILEAHPRSRYLHIGADETSFLGRCPTCASKVSDTSKIALFTGYVAEVCEWVTAKGMRPLLWDDILRREPERVGELPKSTVLVHWNYGSTGARIDDTKGTLSMPDLGNLSVRTKTDKSKPVYALYLEAGFDVLLAPCFAGGGLVPGVTGTAANCRHLAEEAALHGCMGIVSCSWGVNFTTLEQSYYGLAVTADTAWNPLPSQVDLCTQRLPSVSHDFDRRFCRAFLGLSDGTLIHALRLLENGYVYAPGGKVFPTSVSEPSFVDASFLIRPEEYVALGTALFRDDWPTRARDLSVSVTWRAKVESLRAYPGLGNIIAVLLDQLESSKHGLDLLLVETAKATRNGRYLEGLKLGAEARIWRLEYLLYELGALQPPMPRVGLRAKLESFYATHLSAEDARQLASWLLVGLDHDH